MQLSLLEKSVSLQISRNAKNRMLIGLNALMVLITCGKIISEDETATERMQLWLILSPVVLGLAFIRVGSKFAKIAHASLFLYTGAAIGITLGTAISDSASLWLVDFLWLGLASIAVIIHYTANPKDEYLN